MYPSDTIVATSTAQGKAGIGVLRLSGPIAAKIGMCLSRRKELKTRVATSSSFTIKKASKLTMESLFFLNTPVRIQAKTSSKFRDMGESSYKNFYWLVVLS